MTGKQRALAAIGGGITDRCSVLPSVDLYYAAARMGRPVGECFANPRLHAEAISRVFDLHPDIDGAYINLCLSPRTAKLSPDGLYRDSGGMAWQVPENDVGTVKLHEISSLDDERLYTENPLQDGIIETYENVPSCIKDRYLIVPGLTGPYSHLVFMLGLETTMVLMIDDPDGLARALEWRTELALKWAQKYIDMGCECVWIGEGAASSTLISPAYYEAFVMPYAKRVVEMLQTAGVKVIMHVCGDITKSASFIAQTGADSMDIDYMVGMEAARKAARRPVCLKGNLNPAALLRDTREAVYSRCRELISEATGPLILSTGCLVARDTDPSQIEAMVTASKDARNGDA